MKGTIIILMFFAGVFLKSSLLNAFEVEPRISDREIVERLTKLEGGHKSIVKQLDDVNKRIDNVNNSLGRRIDNVNNSLGRRIDDINNSLGKRIDNVNNGLGKRINDVNNSLGKRIDDLRSDMNGRFNVLQWMFGVFISITILILGFVLRMQWHMQKRQTAMETVLDGHKKDFAYIKGLIEKFIHPKGAL